MVDHSDDGRFLTAVYGAPVRTRIFDGIICFGGADWWYHNRGHYDMQMMRGFRRHVPVLYVNSLGMRLPSLTEGKMFFTRVIRKLKSISTSFTRIDERHGVLSPFSVPGRIGMKLSRSILLRQIRSACKAMGIERPLIWVSCPPAFALLDDLDHEGVVYERTDRHEEFPGVDKDAIVDYDRRLKARADATVYCSSVIFEQERPSCKNAIYVDHGVDYDAFATAGANHSSTPADVESIRRPRVGFVGGIDAHTFDPELFRETVRLLPDVHFFLVGANSLPDELFDLPNVRLLGKKQYADVPGYMAAADVLIMPWLQNDWIEACNPVKLKEYLAVGRPVVSTSFHELDNYEGYVHRVSGPEAFAAAIRKALDHPEEPDFLRRRVEKESWNDKNDSVMEALATVGLELQA